MMCKGYTTTDYATQRETLFAVFDDGEVVTTGPVRFSSSFHHQYREWQRIDHLPEDVEFIGYYKLPALADLLR